MVGQPWNRIVAETGSWHPCSATHVCFMKSGFTENEGIHS